MGGSSGSAAGWKTWSRPNPRPSVTATYARYGDVAYVDPAIYYGWAEADLSMTIIVEPFPDPFYAGYLEVNPLEAGWRERAEVYLIKEHLVSIAQFGDRFGSLGYLRQLLDRFA